MATLVETGIIGMNLNGTSRGSTKVECPLLGQSSSSVTEYKEPPFCGAGMPAGGARWLQWRDPLKGADPRMANRPPHVHPPSKCEEINTAHFEESGVDPKKLESARQTFREFNPKFKSFAEPGARLADYELDYKRDACKKACNLMKPFVDESKQLVTDDNARKLLREIIDLTNFLNWRDKQYLEQEFFVDEGDWLRFATLMLACIRELDGDGWQDKLRSLLGWLGEWNCVARLTKLLPTYFLFLWDPVNHIAIKSNFFDRFLDRIGEKRLGSGVPLTVESYLHACDVCRRVREALADWKAKDNIDVHSFAWVISGGWPPDPVTNPPVEVVKSTCTTRPTVPLNVILAGPPGTGKTGLHICRRYALMNSIRRDALALLMEFDGVSDVHFERPQLDNISTDRRTDRFAAADRACETVRVQPISRPLRGDRDVQFAIRHERGIRSLHRGVGATAGVPAAVFRGFPASRPSFARAGPSTEISPDTGYRCLRAAQARLPDRYEVEAVGRIRVARGRGAGRYVPDVRLRQGIRVPLSDLALSAAWRLSAAGRDISRTSGRRGVAPNRGMHR